MLLLPNWFSDGVIIVATYKRAASTIEITDVIQTISRRFFKDKNKVTRGNDNKQ
jgi:hypothetical protein